MIDAETAGRLVDVERTLAHGLCSCGDPHIALSKEAADWLVSTIRSLSESRERLAEENARLGDRECRMESEKLRELADDVARQERLTARMSQQRDGEEAAMMIRIKELEAQLAECPRLRAAAEGDTK